MDMMIDMILISNIFNVSLSVQKVGFINEKNDVLTCQNYVSLLV